MVNRVIKGLVFFLLSSLTIYFLGGIIPKIINHIDPGLEKDFCITFYWLGIISIIGLPQYWVWFTDEDIDLIAPIKSLVAFSTSILAVVLVTLMTNKILASLTLSTTSGIIFTICFWLFAILVMYVPQIFVYEPLKERFADG